MISYEQDPDVVKWGLQLFEGDPFSNCGYYNYGPQNHADYYQEQYTREDGLDIIDNNELLAHTLQEDLSQISVVDTPVYSNEGLEHSQASFYSENWFCPSTGNYSIDHENVNEKADDRGPSCSSPGRQLYGGDEWLYSLELSDEYALDGELGKRLNQMMPIPHIPRINGEIPSVDEATLDHQRLLDRLQVYQLVELKILGDGNCQFRALSDQVYRTPEHHKFVREQVVNQLKSHADIYEGYVPMAYCDYLMKIAKSGEWGDHVTLQAAADLYGVKIFVVTSFRDTCYIEILPSVERSKREVHYNSIYPEGGIEKSTHVKHLFCPQTEASHLTHGSWKEAVSLYMFEVFFLSTNCVFSEMPLMFVDRDDARCMWSFRYLHQNKMGYLFKSDVPTSETMKKKERFTYQERQSELRFDDN